MLKIILVLVFMFYCYEVQGYGYRYNFNPGTGGSNLWMFLPGTEQPTVYNYHGIPGEWPQVYSVDYDGLLPGQPVIPSSSFHDDPNLYRYRGTDGKFRYKCKPDAYYSEYQGKCLWKPSHYAKKRAQG